MSGTVPRRLLLIVTTFLLISSSIQIVLGNNIETIYSNRINSNENENFNDCIILIFGKCNEVTGPLLWRFGLYCTFFKKDFTINADGEFGEVIHVIIRGGGSFKFLWGKENINIQLKGATGILYWGVKSIIVNNTYIIARCQAENAYLTY